MAVPDKKIKSHYENLQKEVTRFRRLYHEQDISVIPDSSLDLLKKELETLEQTYPTLKNKKSQTQTIAGTVKPGFSKVTHTVQQWSFNDIFEKKELIDFIERVNDYAHGESIDFFCEEKIDGLKVILEYKDGSLVRASTRGNGVVGEDVTENVKMIQDIPHTLTKKISLITEGEVYLSVKEFDRINKEQQKKGEDLFANPRNVAAGTLRQLDPALVKARNLSAFIYDIALIDQTLSTQKEENALLQSLGFIVNTHSSVCADADSIQMYYTKRSQAKSALQYWTDGIVIKVNSIDLQKRMGYTGKAPRFAVAYKFPAEQVPTIINNIVFQVGRTGVITPVAECSPTHIAGTTVTRATLHNEDRIKSLDVRVGDTVIMQKAGDIIPEVVSVIKNLRPKKSKPFIWPTHIAECGGDGSIERIDGQSAWRCVLKDSHTIQVKRLAHFTSKVAFDIEGFGKKTVEQFLTCKRIKTYSDIFTLSEKDIIGLEGWKDKSIKNLLLSIRSRSQIKFSRLLVSFSIDGVGEEVALLLSTHFGTIEKLLSAKKDDLQSIVGIGEILQDTIYQWCRDVRTKKELDSLLKHVTIIPDVVSSKHAVSGKRIVITGTFSNYGRDEIKNRLKSLGARISGSVSKNTDYLLAGVAAGSKLKEAHKLSVTVVDEKKLEKWLAS
ncbi:MAG: NAD-dependent DNA ligase LigA [Alphaproteobacteria bacterium]|nr:NAD-dependent DNA ligase LigA [Alphaproteobacteria bacterium]